MSKTLVKISEKKKKTSSLDYPRLARELLKASESEASGDAATSKLAAGLYIVATPIGHLGDMTMRGLVTLALADRVACEDTRVGGGLLSKYGIKKPLVSYHDHNADARRPEILKHIEAGEAVALISDAGMPLIADPGYKLVRACRENGLLVNVIPGANAALAALAGSGLPTDHFYFAGFLPPKTGARQKALTEIKTMAATLVFYEAPQRLKDTLADMVKILGADRQVAIGRELTKLFEETRGGTLDEVANHYAVNVPKGEIVIVVAPPAKHAAEEHDLDALLRTYLRTLSVRDAAAAACDVTGIKKSEVYARALWLAGKNSG
ncbi:MAG TPA: 16S rRNA (cytidine(1402)-2'-O)-methyltransferase [Alphaproteobacteria bacterium]|nr:16S rRNA (cytidine(1402)-2'-O)-methyltransferase [Alphaproteobacteria bacterium]